MVSQNTKEIQPATYCQRCYGQGYIRNGRYQWCPECHGGAGWAEAQAQTGAAR